MLAGRHPATASIYPTRRLGYALADIDSRKNDSRWNHDVLRTVSRNKGGVIWGSLEGPRTASRMRARTSRLVDSRPYHLILGIFTGFYTSLVRRSAGKANSYPMAFTLVKSQVPEWDGRADCEEMPFVALSISSK